MYTLRTGAGFCCSCAFLYKLMKWYNSFLLGGQEKRAPLCCRKLRSAFEGRDYISNFHPWKCLTLRRHSISIFNYLIGIIKQYTLFGYLLCDSGFSRNAHQVLACSLHTSRSYGERRCGVEKPRDLPKRMQLQLFSTLGQEQDWKWSWLYMLFCGRRLPRRMKHPHSAHLADGKQTQIGMCLWSFQSRNWMTFKNKQPHLLAVMFII